MLSEAHLAPRAANYRPLSPADFLLGAVEAFGSRTAVIWRDRSWTYRGFAGVASRLSAWLGSVGIGRGDVVSFMCANRPEMLAAHYGVPAVGAVLNGINTRLDAEAVSYILRHSESRVLVADSGCFAVANEAGRRAGVSVVLLSDHDGVRMAGSACSPRQRERTSASRVWKTNGNRFASTTHPARPVIRRVSSTIIVAPI